MSSFDISVLLVSKENVCRSVIAQALMCLECRKTTQRVLIDSCGVDVKKAGVGPNCIAEACFLARRIEIFDHASRQLTKEDFERYDYILTFDNANYEAAMGIRDGVKQKKSRFFSVRRKKKTPKPIITRAKLRRLTDYYPRALKRVDEIYDNKRALEVFQNTFGVIKDCCRGFFETVIRRRERVDY
ncbi:DgyrCDS9523 [Dimorphilus gyrociliatus]|uniref:protein-tyrosine-phosphatase n=1 Tax=Dimorphilus gyrociliatus TaxID=2664684 RepID=A0A7I8VYP4_9ANNE|nr:DgyrCDS9523 [Dimorphilus gyrociliatus]